MAKHSISLPQSGMSPSNWYAVARSQPGFALDPAQAQAIMRLDQLYQELLDFKRVRSRPLGKLEIFGHALMPQRTLPVGWGGAWQESADGCFLRRIAISAQTPPAFS